VSPAEKPVQRRQAFGGAEHARQERWNREADGLAYSYRVCVSALRRHPDNAGVREVMAALVQRRASLRPDGWPDLD
jgi:hypothetical protein